MNQIQRETTSAHNDGLGWGAGVGAAVRHGGYSCALSQHAREEAREKSTLSGDAWFDLNPTSQRPEAPKAPRHSSGSKGPEKGEK